jgi:hypothetical protein
MAGWPGTLEIVSEIFERMLCERIGGCAGHGESICGTGEHAFEAAMFQSLPIVENT